MINGNNLTDRVALALNSLGFVIVAMFATKTMQMVFSHSFYESAFPEMETWEAVGATWSLAVGWELALLIVTMNAQQMPPFARNVLIVLSGINMLFFIDAFNPDLTGKLFYGRLFIGAVSTSIDFVYITVFDKKWRERKFMQQLPDKLRKTEADLQQATAKVQQLEADVQQATAALKQSTADMQQLTKKVQQFEAKLKCPYCGEAFESSGALNAHKGRYCEKNPKNGDQTNVVPIKINGHNHNDV